MNLEDVKRRVAAIRAMAADDEAAHCAEDGLRADLLAAIAVGTCEDPAACAAAALETERIEFARWCA